MGQRCQREREEAVGEVGLHGTGWGLSCIFVALQARGCSPAEECLERSWNCSWVVGSSNRDRMKYAHPGEGTENCCLNFENLTAIENSMDLSLNVTGGLFLELVSGLTKKNEGRVVAW